MRNKNQMSKQLQSKLLASVVEFMTRAGVPESDIKVAFKKALVEARPAKTPRRSSNLGGRYPHGGDISAHLLRLWHREDKYVGSGDSMPRPLFLSKGRHSLRNLIAKLNPDVNAVEVLKSMRAAGLIRRTAEGRYLPTTSAAVIPPLHPWAAEHAARSVVRLISTVRRNSLVDSNDPRLLERYSYVPDLDPAEAGAFAEFARSQGQAYLDTLDDWLEQRRARLSVSSRTGSAGIAAGVHVITYLGNEAHLRERESPTTVIKKGVPAPTSRRRSTPKKRPTPPPATHA